MEIPLKTTIDGLFKDKDTKYTVIVSVKTIWDVAIRQKQNPLRF